MYRAGECTFVILSFCQSSNFFIVWFRLLQEGQCWIGVAVFDFVIHSIAEVFYEVVKNGWVHVLAELHQDEIVPEPEFLHHDRDVAVFAGTGASTKHQKSATS